MRPCAFFWRAGKLYVGYARDGKLHRPNEKPVWDPMPVELGTYIDTKHGYYHFERVYEDRSRYFRKFAVVRFHCVYRPGEDAQKLKRVVSCQHANGYDYVSPDHGIIPIDETFTFHPNCYLEHQWFSPMYQLLCEKDRISYCQKEYLFRHYIKPAPSLDHLRSGPKKEREKLEKLCGAFEEHHYAEDVVLDHEARECICPCRCGCIEPSFAVLPNGMCPDCEEGNHEVDPNRERLKVDLSRYESIVAHYKKVLSRPEE